ncbi:MAG: threonine--tRNA ligase [Betaproteobacteria bacterium]|nr:threonine--tRNA ligase [Betaproteobacteria bacterium]
MVQITLPDGSLREFPGPVTVAEVAASIGAGLAKAALAGKVDGKVVDTSFTIAANAQLAIITGKDADGLEVVRHSTAHLLAYAVKDLYPDAQVTIGPVIENGFYYDFSYSRPFTLEDLAAIEKRMTELANKDEPVVRRVLPRDEAVAYFKGMGEHYKAEIIGSIPSNEDVSLYKEGTFEDLCRGPHVPSTGKLKHFKLMKVAGAYWRGDSKNEMLQRIYGTAWTSKDDLQNYLTQLEEAEKRDHRKLGRELDLFHIDEHAPGLVFWHPKGWSVWQKVEQYMRAVYQDNGYQEVKGPQIIDKSLWEKTGHWDKYRDNMFTTESEKRDYALKPMNCPGHILIFKQGMKSYRDLPLRYGEFGQCHRNEPTGGLHGIMRVRGFTQDDGHIFCTEDQILAESVNFTTLLQKVYKDFGFTDIIYKVATRPAQRIGSDEIWDKAEHALMESLRASNCDFEIAPGDGAFYGYCREIAQKMQKLAGNQGLRVDLDLRNEKITYKIREHSLQKPPYILVAGDKEKAAGTVAVRARGNKDLGVMSVDAFIELVQSDIESKV